MKLQNIPTDREIEYCGCKDCGDTYVIFESEETRNGYYINRVKCTKCNFYVSKKYSQSAYRDGDLYQRNYNETIMHWNLVNKGSVE